MPDIENLLAEVQGLSGPRLMWEACVAIGFSVSTGPMGRSLHDPSVPDEYGSAFWPIEREEPNIWPAYHVFDLNRALEWLDKFSLEILSFLGVDPYAADIDEEGRHERMWAVPIIHRCSPDDRWEPPIYVRGASPAEAVMRACVLVSRMKGAAT